MYLYINETPWNIIIWGEKCRNSCLTYVPFLPESGLLFSLVQFNLASVTVSLQTAPQISHQCNLVLIWSFADTVSPHVNVWVLWDGVASCVWQQIASWLFPLQENYSAAVSTRPHTKLIIGYFQPLWSEITAPDFAADEKEGFLSLEPNRFLHEEYSQHRLETAQFGSGQPGGTMSELPKNQPSLIWWRSVIPASRPLIGWLPPPSFLWSQSSSWSLMVCWRWARSLLPHSFDCVFVLRCDRVCLSSCWQRRWRHVQWKHCDCSFLFDGRTPAWALTPAGN